LLAVLVLRVVLLLRVVSLVLTQVQSRLIHMLEEMLLRQVAPAVPVVQRVMVERVVLVLLALPVSVVVLVQPVVRHMLVVLSATTVWSVSLLALQMLLVR
jgi:hypothetical protein